MFLENICLRVSEPCQNPYMILIIIQGVRVLTRLRLGLSHLNEPQFWRLYNPLCTCSLEVESISHFFLHCHYYNNISKTLSEDLKVINVNVLKLSETALTDLLLYGEESFDNIQNKMILSASIKFIVLSDRFIGSFLQYRKFHFVADLQHGSCW